MASASQLALPHPRISDAGFTIVSVRSVVVGAGVGSAMCLTGNVFKVSHIKLSFALSSRCTLHLSLLFLRFFVLFFRFPAGIPRRGHAQRGRHCLQATVLDRGSCVLVPAGLARVVLSLSGTMLRTVLQRREATCVQD